MTPDEFWGATLAQVTELYRVQILTWARTRDYFVSEIAALTINKLRREQSDKVWSADDFLAYKYPRLQKDVMITHSQQHDPDKGAVCPWQDMRQSLRDRDTARKTRVQ